MSPSGRNLRRYLALYRPHWWKLLLGNLGCLVQSLSLVPVPWIFGRIIDKSLPAHDFHAIVVDCLVILGLYLLYISQAVTARYLNLWVTKQVVFRIRVEAIQKLQQLSIGFFDKEDKGRLHSRVIHDSERVDVMSNFVATVLVVSGVTALTTFAILFSMSPAMTLVVASILPLFWLGQAFFKKRILERHRAWKEQFDGFSARVQEMLQAMRLMRAFATEEREYAVTAGSAASLSDRGVKWVTLIAFYQSLMEGLIGLAQVVVLLGGSWLVLKGRFTLGELVAYFSFLAILFNPVRAILTNMDQYFAGRVALDSLYEILDAHEVEPSRDKGLDRPLKGAVEFESVSFAYDNGTRALREVGMRAEPGQMVALVGPSGSGKSTFANLLLGFYRPQQGVIRFDGAPLAEYSSRCLRGQMGVVAQDNILLSGTLRDNIAYGKWGASDREVELAARLACAHEFISQLEKGYSSEVGDMGVRLSGGQRQRIAIARAILRDPRILILDEATSALDSSSERAVQEGLKNLMKQRTTFVIAHRLGTVRQADLILVFQEGRVVERGRHEDLAALGGVYAGLLKSQFSLAA